MNDQPSNQTWLAILQNSMSLADEETIDEYLWAMRNFRYDRELLPDLLLLLRAEHYNNGYIQQLEANINEFAVEDRIAALLWVLPDMADNNAHAWVSRLLLPILSDQQSTALLMDAIKNADPESIILLRELLL